MPHPPPQGVDTATLTVGEEEEEEEGLLLTKIKMVGQVLSSRLSPSLLVLGVYV